MRETENKRGVDRKGRRRGDGGKEEKQEGIEGEERKVGSREE